MRPERPFLCALMALFSLGIASAQEPYWWPNPHQDDDYDMYERGSAVNASTEQAALLEAVGAAKNMLVQRIGIAPALAEVGIDASAEYAIVDFEVFGSGTEKTSKGWNAWVLIKYPQERKKELMDRWNASIASMQELRKNEPKIPVQFSLSLSTIDDRHQYREGESIALTVRAEENCYLLLVDHQSDGSTVLLFPNRFHPDSFVRKGQLIQIPSQNDATFKLIVQAPFGDDRIEAIASTKKSALHAKFVDQVEGLPEDQDVAVSTRGIFVQGLTDAIASSMTDAIKWSRSELVLSTYPAK
jgi:hypothetical protein